MDRGSDWLVSSYRNFKVSIIKKNHKIELKYFLSYGKTMKCPNCEKKNDGESNFCVRCGTSLSNLQEKKCPICLEHKKLESLGCGHLVCLECLKKSYEIKKECPECRKEIKQCHSCQGFRVIKMKKGKIEKCLDCGVINKLRNSSKLKKYTCLECHSNRLLYNHVSDSWNCLDCFQNFKIEGHRISVATNILSTTTICTRCCSNQLIDNSEGGRNCLHCYQENTNTKIVSLEEFSLLRIKEPEEVNVKKTVTKKCGLCKKDNIFKMMNANQFDYTYYCYTCRQSDVPVTNQ